MAESTIWSELPGEILCMVEERLAKLKDVIRFRATCKPWRRSLTFDRRKFRQSLPWLMLPYCGGDVDSSSPAAGCKGSGDGCRRVFDVAEQKFHHIELPEGLDKTTCRGSAFGWVFTLQRTPSMFLLNPLTRDEIPLPPITTFHGVLKYRPERIGHEYLRLNESGYKIAKGKKFFEERFINKMALSADPASERDFVVMVIHHFDDLKLAFCRPRDDNGWTSIPRLGPEPIYFNDVVFWRGQFYASDSRCRVVVCDISIPGRPRLRWFVDPEVTVECAENVYLLVSPTGDELMMVARYISYPVYENDAREGEDEDDILVHGDEADIVCLDKDSDDEHCIDPGVSLDREVHHTIRFRVFKLNEDARKWDEVRGIGEYALFLGYNTSTYVSTRDHPEIMPNFIYFTDDMLDFHYKKVLGGSDMGIFSLSTGSVQPLYDARSHHNNPSFISPFPVWFLPSNF